MKKAKLRPAESKRPVKKRKPSPPGTNYREPVTITGKVVVKRPKPVVLVIEGPPRELTKMEKLVKWWSEFI